MLLIFLATLSVTTGQQQGREPPRAEPRPPRAQPRPPAQSGDTVYFANCTAARAAGRENIRRGEPGYRPPLDRDNDGVACEAR